MHNLRYAIKNAVKYKRRTISKLSNSTRPKAFSVPVLYEVTVVKCIHETVIAQDETDALLQARKQFNVHPLEFKEFYGKLCTSKVKMGQPWAREAVQLKGGLQLSQSQQIVMGYMNAGYYLYPRRSHNYILKLVGDNNDYSYYDIENRWRMVSRLTFEALYKKGVIIPFEQALLDNDELKMQIALGTLPRTDMYVINTKQIAKSKLKLKVLTP